MEAVKAALAPRDCVSVSSRAADRRDYLRRPDLGRRLAAADAERLERCPCDIAFVIADGLSARAAEKNGPPLLQAALPLLAGWSVGPIVLARQARVALGDEIGERLTGAIRLHHAGLIALLIGERPGLSASDSLGVYLTSRPHVGCNDSQRNCISNIRPGGLTYDEAAARLAWLAHAARRLGATGVRLKDEYAPVLTPQGEPKAIA
jgi:ethanolamine ammonia-lyase small subunit